MNTPIMTFYIHHKTIANLCHMPILKGITMTRGWVNAEQLSGQGQSWGSSAECWLLLLLAGEIFTLFTSRDCRESSLSSLLTVLASPRAVWSGSRVLFYENSTPNVENKCCFNINIFTSSSSISSSLQYSTLPR